MSEVFNPFGVASPGLCIGGPKDSTVIDGLRLRFPPAAGRYIGHHLKLGSTGWAAVYVWSDLDEQTGLDRLIATYRNSL